MQANDIQDCLTACEVLHLWKLILFFVQAANKIFYKRMLFYFLAQISLNLFFWIYFFVGYWMNALKNNYQWILAIFIPLVRELFYFVLAKLTRIASQADDLSVQLSSMHMAYSRHALFLSVQMASVATNLSCGIILALDIILDMALMTKIIWRFKRNKNNIDDEIIAGTQEMVIGNKLAVTIPLAYSICFLMARYGPNVSLLRDISEQDAEQTMTIMALFIFVQSCATVSVIILLWVFCKINIYKVEQFDCLVCLAIF